jgi:O-antigen/teichoic acid export membrane protein
MHSNKSDKIQTEGIIRKKLKELCKGNDFKAQLIRAGMGSVGIQVLNRIFALAFGILLARVMGLENYGIYAYAFAIMSLLLVVAEAGVPTLLLREVAAAHGRQEWGVLRGVLQRARQLVLLVSISVSLLGLLVLVLFADNLEPNVLYTTGLMLLVLPVVSLLKYVDHAIQGLRRVVIGQAVAMLRPMLVLLFVTILFWIWPAYHLPQHVMAAQLVVALAVLLFAVILLKNLIPVESKKAEAEYRNRQWLMSALPFVLIGGAGIVNNQADIIMLGWFRPAEDVGIYRVAVQGAVLVAFGLQVVNAVVAPQFSRLYVQGDMKRLQHLVTLSARISLLIAIPVVLVFSTVGDTIVSWVFGVEYVGAYLPLTILAIGQLINAGFGSVGFLLNMTGHERIVSKILWQTASLNIILNLALIPYFGLAGAAIASTISLSIWNLLLYRQARKHLSIISIAF